MLPDPLHPAVVHFPIVLAMLLPIMVLWALLALRRTERPRALWIPVVVAGALLFGSSLLAKETGEDQEERVEQVVGESAIEQHHEWADPMVVVSGVVFFLVLAGLLPGTIGRLGRWISLLAAVVAMVLVVEVGATGGELVYKHGAASAYVEDGGPGGGAAAETARRHSEREDDD